MSCRADANVEVWLSQGNVSEFVVYTEAAGVRTYVTDLSGVTQGVICINNYTLDSDDDATLLWWTDSVSSKTLPDGTSFTGDVVRARLGQTPSLVAGDYSGCELLLYGSIEGITYNTTSGPLVVSDSLSISVTSTCS